MAKKVVLAGACRTAIGTMGGGLSTVPAADLGSIVIKEALKRTNVPADQVDEVLMGCVIQAGLGQNVARQASINAGLPIEVPAVTINVVCGSGLNCVNLAATKILAGEADIVIAGGMENMSLAPFCLDKARFGYRMNNGVLKDCMVNDALTDAFNQYHMGITAENIVKNYGVTREEMDRMAYESNMKAAKAQKEGKLAPSIIPVTVVDKDGNEKVVTEDEGIRPTTTMETLAGLKPCFIPAEEGGTVTAATSSQTSDAAAFVVLMAADKAKELGIKPIAKMVSFGVAGCDATMMGLGPIYAVPKALKRAGKTIDDMDVIELNEAFAAQAIPCIKVLKMNPEKVNPYGGAMALGHPMGATGAFLTCKALDYLQDNKKTTALVTMCIGGGMGAAAVFELL